jgi:arabinofuranosyltransferase
LRRIALEDLAAYLTLGAYVIWAGLFILQSSYIGIDGHRYFGLFDDAMISMRYAWNFAHGQGLVWNAGQRVEGYSNLLMTLLMAAAALFLNKSLAVLAIQILGIPVVLLIAYLTRRIAIELRPGEPYAALIGLLSLGCVLFYYPLSYWTLMGMETGLLTLFILAGAWFALRWLETNRTTDLLAVSITSGLAFLTRNDAILLTAVTFAYLGFEVFIRRKEAARLKRLLYAALLVALFPIGQTLFRLVYYGQILPNTYYLKLTGIPLLIRVIGGSRFVFEFLQETWPLFALAVVGLILKFRLTRLYLAGFMAVAIAYQIYAGGDPWESWRLLAPAMPALFILAIEAALICVSRIGALGSQRYAVATSVCLLTLLPLALADQPFLADMAVRGPTSAAIANRVNTNAAIAINALTVPGASIGVIWAGILPYYTDRVGVDFLGKSDARIAHLQADISGAVSWGGMISVPGHNKYDLEYSIVELQPTYVQVYSWGYQTVKPWVVQHYVRLDYQGVAGSKTVWLLKDSPLVCWDACRSQYKIVPWPNGQN